MSDDIVVGGWNVVGDGEEGFVVGQHLARYNGHRARHRIPKPHWMGNVPGQGISLPQEEMDPLPFVAVTVAAAGTTGQLLARPQRPFRGERLVLFATKISDGSDFSLNALINGAIFVGATQIGAAQGQTPFNAFRPDAFGVRLSWPAAGQGTDIVIPFILSTAAPSGGVFVSGVVFGRAVR